MSFMIQDPGAKLFFFLCDLPNGIKARVFLAGKPVQPSVMEHSGFYGPFISYQENKVS